MLAHPFDEPLRRAIAEKRLLRVRYHSRARIVEPHDYGVKQRTPRLLAYQIADDGKPAATGWRFLELGKIEELVVLDETFPGSRGDQHHRHNQWDELFARVT